MSAISSDHMRICDRAGRCARKRGFTLVEVMVVIGILVILIAILMPVFGRIRETSKRTKCAANLHTIGQMATLFANDHHGFFPACYRQRDVGTTGYPYRIPQYITTDTTHDTDDSSVTGWQQYGTSWNIFRQYAAVADSRLYSTPTGSTVAMYDGDPSLSIFSCPSNDVPAYELDSTAPQFGNIIVTNYAFVGGLSEQNIQINTTLVTGSLRTQSHWGSAPPAVSTAGAPLYIYETNPSNSADIIIVPVGTAPLAQTVLAADLVFYTGSGGYAPAKGVSPYKINHPRTGDNTMPDFQNVLYGDGRVEGHNWSEYPYPLNDDTSANGNTPYTYNWSMRYATQPKSANDTASTNGYPGFYYWGEPESTPPLVMPPPSTDAAPPPVNNGVSSLSSSYVPPPAPNAPPGIPTPPPPPPEGGPSALPG